MQTWNNQTRDRKEVQTHRGSGSRGDSMLGQRWQAGSESSANTNLAITLQVAQGKRVQKTVLLPCFYQVKKVPSTEKEGSWTRRELKV